MMTVLHISFAPSGRPEVGRLTPRVPLRSTRGYILTPLSGRDLSGTQQVFVNCQGQRDIFRGSANMLLTRGLQARRWSGSNDQLEIHPPSPRQKHGTRNREFGGLGGMELG
jgi:hypothetical protein